MSVIPQLVSVVIPIFNEENGIAHLKEKLLRLNAMTAELFKLEFIFVDDGSNDHTVGRLGEQFSSTGIPFVICEHGVNRGVGAAFRTGFQRCTGDYVCTIDADCTYSPEGLRLLLAALVTENADVAVASPYHPEGGVEGVSYWRLALSRRCSALYRWASPLKLYTYTSIFRAYRSAVVHNVPFSSDGFVSAAEILLAANRQGYSVIEIPMILRARSIGSSKMKVLRTIISHLRMLGRFVAGSSSERLAAKTEVQIAQSRQIIPAQGRRTGEI